MRRSLCKHIKLLGGAFVLLGEPIKLPGKFPVDRSEVSLARVLRSAALFDRPRTVIVGIVWHDS